MSEVTTIEPADDKGLQPAQNCPPMPDVKPARTEPSAPDTDGFVITQAMIPKAEPAPLDPMLAMVNSVINSKDFDIEKMKTLVGMRDAEIARQAEIAFNESFSVMQNKLPRVVSTHQNKMTGSKYAKVEDINDAVLPVLSKHGFSILFKTSSQTKEGIKISATLGHSQGHKESTDIYMPYDNKGLKGNANKTDIHATAATITYARRYAMCMLLNISTGDDNDGNNGSTEFITPEQVALINKLLDETDADEKVFLDKYMKARSVNEILVKDYKKAIIALEDNRQLKEKLEKGESNANTQ